MAEETKKKSGLYKMLANAKTKGSNDGAWIAPRQQGLILVHKFFEQTNGLKKSVIFVGEVLESNATEAGAPVQPKGTMVKKVYALSKRDWKIDELKTDIVNMIGIDEKSLSTDDIEEIFEGVFEKQAMRGCIVSFNSVAVTNDKEGNKRKFELTNVYFKETKGEINSDEAVEARAVEITAKYEAAKQEKKAA